MTLRDREWGASRGQSITAPGPPLGIPKGTQKWVKMMNNGYS